MNKVRESGVSLITLSIAIIIMVIIAGTLIYGINNNADVKRLKNLYSDIEVLQDKVSNWYNTNGAIPGEPYENADKITEIFNAGQIGQDDGETYYKIDVQVFDNLTLNYGKGHINNEDEDDIYIINEESHKIYYLKGIKSDGKIYYTNEVNANDIDLVSDIKINLVEVLDNTDDEENERLYKADTWTNKEVKLKSIDYIGNSENKKIQYAISELNGDKNYQDYDIDEEKAFSQRR